MKEDEQLKSLLADAGGLNSDAYFQSVHIERIIPFNQRKDYLNNILDITLDFNSVDELINSPYVLDDGDVVTISSINLKLQNHSVVIMEK